MDQIRQPWDRREDESPQAYCAFVAYRDMRAERSIDNAYRAVRGVQKGVKRASGCFKQWASDYNWKVRAEEYDGYLERKMRRQFEQSESEAYSDGIAAYHERQKRLGAAAMNAGIGLLTKASEGLKTLDATKLKPLELAAIFRAAAAVATFGRDSETIGLGVDMLMKDLEKNA